MIDKAGSSAIKTCIVIAGFFLGVLLCAGPAQARQEGEADYDRIISSLAEQYGVEPALVKAVIRAESCFDRHAVSPRGARGLMQLMPPIARSHGVVDPSDPWQNIRGGVFATIYAVAIATFGGTAQLVVTWLLHVTGDPLAPCWYLLLAAIVGIVVGRQTEPKLGRGSIS